MTKGSRLQINLSKFQQSIETATRQLVGVDALLRLAVAVPRHLPHRDDPHTQDASRRSLPVSHYLQIERAFSTKWKLFHYLQIGKDFPICHIGKASSIGLSVESLVLGSPSGL